MKDTARIIPNVQNEEVIFNINTRTLFSLYSGLTGKVSPSPSIRILK